ncbi:MAG: bifunctional 5,10-methylenetetrahydrofolate dehydrogenase/5,10-methenyltetrahydrofolate cyclohydrolase [Sphaerobacter thermophilus]|uniref:bifunctional 5,10-methylenetetrahydrofolate dehydrogenase/5,10-methenyltetrahydrofolate cyclohydrolase n=1 Tax=Sphaerobacter thermophilus TaxID=2057 RepID=UPI00396DBF17
MAIALEGRPVARAILERAREELAEYVTQAGRPPELATVLAGDDASAAAYVRAIHRTFDRVGIPVRDVTLPGDVAESELRDAVERLNADPAVSGIIILQPLPRHLPAGIASELVDPAKDVDGVTPYSAGRLAVGLPALPPSTPAGGMAILEHYGIEIAGSHAVVIGRSPVVGLPMALMLIAADATVTVCHSRTPDLPAMTRQADILVAAAGRPGLVRPEMVKPGATVIDFGVSFVDGRMVGDVEPAVGEVAGALTPVPGGTGAVTNAILVQNTLRAAWAALGGRRAG